MNTQDRPTVPAPKSVEETLYWEVKQGRLTIPQACEQALLARKPEQTGAPAESE